MGDPRDPNVELERAPGGWNLYWPAVLGWTMLAALVVLGITASDRVVPRTGDETIGVTPLDKRLTAIHEFARIASPGLAMLAVCVLLMAALNPVARRPWPLLLNTMPILVWATLLVVGT